MTTPPGTTPRFQPHELEISPAARRRCQELGIAAHAHGHTGYPQALVDDPEPPAVLFSRGDLTCLDGGLSVGIVGTRNATIEGRDIARWFGRELSAAGVRVVSGLAAGIDTAAHRGAVEAGGAPPVAVVGSGLDVVYPRSNALLFDDVANLGVVVSEYEPGIAPLPHHFPLRNRIIAALSTVLLVVESRAAGGSLITVGEAEARGRDILAVPGSVRSPNAQGTNRLLRDGCLMALDPDDVLVALGLASRDQAPLPFSRRGRTPSRRWAPSDDDGSRLFPPAPSSVRAPSPSSPVAAADAWLLDVVEGAGTTIDEVVLRSGRGLDEVLVALERLDDAGHVVQDGPWIRRGRA